MGNKAILDHTSLQARIAALKSEKTDQEVALKQELRGVIQNFQPAAFFQEAIHELASSDDAQVELTKVGLGFISKFIVDQLFGTDKTSKRYVTGMLVNRATTVLIDNNAVAIVAGFKQMFQQEKEEE